MFQIIALILINTTFLLSYLIIRPYNDCYLFIQGLIYESINMIISFLPTIYHWKPFENPMMWVYIFLLAILALLFHFSFVKSCALVSLNKLIPIFYSSIIFSGIFEWMVFGKIPTLMTVGGALLIIIGGVVSSVFEKEKVVDVG